MEFNTLLTIEQLTKEYRFPNAKKRNGEWSIKAEELYRLQCIIKTHTELAKPLIDDLRELSQYESSTDGSFLYSKILRKGSVDYTKVPELEGVDLESYRKSEVESWKLTKV